MSRQEFPKAFPTKRLVTISDKFAAVCYIIEGEQFQNLCRVENPDGTFNYSEKCIAQLPYYSVVGQGDQRLSSLNISSSLERTERAVALYENQNDDTIMPPFKIFLSYYWFPLLVSVISIFLLALVVLNWILPMFKRNLKKGREVVIEDTDGNLSIGKIKFHPSDVLGIGSKGTCVYRGSFEKSQDCAIKRIVAQCINFADREVDFLRSLQHPNLVRYLATENDPQFIYIALELADCTLRSLIESENLDDLGLTKEEICKQSALGLQYLHKLDIVHRDIKPENILISFPKRPGNERNVMITDFGLSKQLTTLETVHSSSVMRYFDGTQGWMPPEIIRAKEENKNLAPSKSADIFSLGCVFYYIIFDGKHPFGDAPNEREENIKADKCELNLFRFNKENEHANIREELVVMGNDLIKAMIEPIAENRPPIGSILKYPLFWKKKDQLQFLSEVSDRLDKNADTLVRSLERGRQRVFGYDWKQCLSKALVMDLENPHTKHRSYNEKRLQDLLRLIRNKKNHYTDCPSDLKEDFGEVPDQFLDYFSSRFPELIVHVYIAVQNLKEEPKFRDYFDLEEEYTFKK